jgi:hypothetical protein
MTRDTRGTREWAAILLLAFGGFIFVIGWIVGLALLWSSRAWTYRDKLIGTLVIPGGLAGSVLVILRIVRRDVTCLRHVIIGLSSTVSDVHEHCTSAASTVAGIPTGIVTSIVLLLPFATAAYLARRAK